MFKAINGWTKRKILKVLNARRYNAAAVKDGTCAYTTPNGNRCAVGMFIPKGHKGGSYQGDVGELIENHPDLESKMPLDLSGMGALQSIHDDCGETGFNSSPENKNAKKAMIDWVKANVE